MQFRRRTQTLETRIDLTSLIDIMFILIVFFLLSSNFNIPTGIKINLPEAKMSKRIVTEHHEININSLNQILFNDKIIKLISLREVFLNLNNDTPVILRSDVDSNYGVIIQVFDLLRELKFEKVTLGTLKSEL